MKKPQKPSLESIKQKKLTKELRGLKHLPNSQTREKIDSKMFPLDANKLYHYKPENLAAEEYKRCLELFEMRLPYEHSMQTNAAVPATGHKMQAHFNFIFVKEAPVQEQLQKAAVDIVTEIFDIPEHLIIIPELKSDVGVDTEDQDDSPDEFLSLTEEEKIQMRDEIQKRIILNGLVHGSAMHIWKSAHYLIKEKIDEINPLLMTMYNEYTAGMGWLFWQMPPGMGQDADDSFNLGVNSLDFDDQGNCNVHCHAVNFPVLIHEITKGAMDYLICHGIPQEYTEEQLRYYYAKADDYDNEFWHYLLSPSLWVSLINAADLDSQALPGVIAGLAKLSYQDLVEIFSACIDDKDLGRAKLLEFKIV